MKSNKGARYWVNLASFAILASLFAIGAGGVWLAYTRAYALIRPNHNYPKITPSDVGIEPWENVYFPSPDGLKIAAWFVPPKPEAKGAVIIFVHGMGGTRDQLLTDAALLYDHGFGALLIDLRNCGDSEGDTTTLGYSGPNPTDRRCGRPKHLHQPGR